MKWEPNGYGKERYVDADGKILADVEDSLVRTETTATLRDHVNIGTYISRAAAKRAVERYFSLPPACSPCNPEEMKSE
jgi:hypothetical protein